MTARRALGAVVVTAALVTGCAASHPGSSAGSSAGLATAVAPAELAAAGPAASAHVTAAKVSALRGKWKPILTDNFSGKKLNTNLWQAGWFGTGITKSVNTNDRACNRSSQVKVSGGELHITAKRQTIVCGGVKHHYVTGMVSTNPTALGRGKGFQFTHGLVEARVKIPGDGKGHCANWASMWLNGQVWPDDGEVDVFECLNGVTTWNLHTGPGAGGMPVIDHRIAGKTTGWHTVALEWTAKRATVYLDGKKLGSHRYVVNHPNYLVFANEIRVGSKIVLPSTLDVNWVKVFKAAKGKGARRINLAA